jgi:hypothetical protein
MAGKPPFMFDPAAWVQDTRMLSLETRAVWMDLLCLMHDSVRRGYLIGRHGEPYTTEQVAAFCGCPVEAASRALQELISSGTASSTDTGTVYCRRMVKAENKRHLCSEAGKRGGGNPTFKGLPKGSPKGGSKGTPKGTPKGGAELFGPDGFTAKTPEGDATGLPSPSAPPFPPPTPPSLSPPPPPKKARAPAPPADPLFDRFWEAYPLKAARLAARKAWAKLRPDGALLDVLLAALARQKESAQWREGVIPHASTWLNGRRWEDEVLVAGSVPDPQETPLERAARLQADREAFERQRDQSVRGLPGPKEGMP